MEFDYFFPPFDNEPFLLDDSTTFPIFIHCILDSWFSFLWIDKPFLHSKIGSSMEQKTKRQLDKEERKKNDKRSTNVVKLWFTKMLFVGFYSVPNLIVILFNLLYPVFVVWFVCKGCMLERERVWRLKQLKPKDFSQVSRD